jgi:hypothetical protein
MPQREITLRAFHKDQLYFMESRMLRRLSDNDLIRRLVKSVYSLLTSERQVLPSAQICQCPHDQQQPVILNP